MERRVVFCLLCNTPQLSIRTHLHRVCMKEHTPEQRAMEEVRARTSQKHFNRVGRVWKFSELETFCKDAASCVALCQRLESRGLLVADSPPTYQHIEPSKRSHDVDILATAADDMDFFKSRLVVGHSLPKVAVTSLRSYCVAIMLLQHRIATNAVVEFEVQQWLDRKPVSGGATILLAVRWQQDSVSSPSAHERRGPVSMKEQGRDKGRFFIGKCGSPLSNPSSDLQRLKKKVLTTGIWVCGGGRLTLRLHPRQGQPPGASLSDPLMGQNSLGSVQTHIWIRPELEGFLRQQPSPVSLHAAPPNEVPVCHAVGRQGNRPTEAAVQRVLGKERWTTNRPCVEDLLKAWVPPQQVNGGLPTPPALSPATELEGPVVEGLWPGKGQRCCRDHGHSARERLCVTSTGADLQFCREPEGAIGLPIFFSQTLLHRRHHGQEGQGDLPRRPEGRLSVPRPTQHRVGEELMWDYNIKRQSFGGEGKDLPGWTNE
ncbi:hypothetical protein KUCAC02_035924 [Chaenocephalus aceratus]|nr:hypothetical protein KUCAC02_035924 [Chaenocephalus aceratus]